jgi:hypothetical protein
MNGVSLIMAILEHLGENDQQIISYIHHINDLYL